MHESHKRTLIKTLIYRVSSLGLTVIVVAYLTGTTFGASFSLSALLNVALSVYYYYYERVWSKISYGKRMYPKD